MVEVQFTDVDTRHPDISQLVGRGIFFALSDNKGLIAQRNGQNGTTEMGQYEFRIVNFDSVEIQFSFQNFSKGKQLFDNTVENPKLSKV